MQAHPDRRRRCLGAALGLLLLVALPAQAQAQAPAANTTVRLIELLIQNGVLTRDQAEMLMRQAAAEAAAAAPARRPAARAAVVAPVPVPAEPQAPAGTIRVPYVPETVRRQLREEVRRDVIAQAREEGWARPGSQPEWVERVRLFGDIRLRGEQILFPSGNAAGFFPNFNSINNGTGFDLGPQSTTNAPFLNLTDDRTRFRLRARLGLEARLDEDLTATFRVATGNDTSPVSTNQTFGQPGFFSKYAIWLDQAYFRFTPTGWLTVEAGRMPNPFWSTDLLYDIDLNFDGVAARVRRPILDGVTGFLTVGAFPYFNTDLNFGTNNVEKTTSRDRYLAAVQGGIDWQIARDYALRLGLGYYNFTQAEGSPSAPCFAPTAADSCDTDTSRAQFTQNTNTFFPIRSIVANPGNPLGPQLQYFGLASKFEILDFNARLSIAAFAPYLVTLEGNVLQNLAYDRNRIERRGPVNNLAANGGRFQGGGTGYLLRATVGHAQADRRWDWNVFFSYRYLESDAVLDALTDSDFRLGGTNSKGYILGGTLGVARNTALRARYLSGTEVSGAPYRADIVQLDLLGRF